eukprot:12905315-Prorocentrum_lima.AAC.1
MSPPAGCPAAAAAAGPRNSMYIVQTSSKSPHAHSPVLTGISAPQGHVRAIRGCPSPTITTSTPGT